MARSINSIEEIQSITLAIMKEIHGFCMIHGIRYSLACGTLLGAVRHGGFIPWDDDIDIMMPRPDYERFIKTFSSEQYQVTSLDDNEYYYPYAKVFDTRTFLKEELIRSYDGLGVFVDIFPVDGVPQSSFQQRVVHTKQRFLYKLHMSMKYPFSREWGAAKNCLIACSRTVGLFVPLRTILLKLDRQARNISFDTTKESAVLTGDSRVVLLPPHAFDELIETNFEDTLLCAVKDHHHYLSSLYGDYMELPSMKDRKSEHRYEAGWKDGEGVK